MTKRLTTCLGWTTAVLVAGLGASTPALAEHMNIVLPGGSIQEAVDKAGPGDTIHILPGVYRESVLINKSHVTLVGSGRRTVIKGGFTTGGVNRSGSGNTCAGHGNGICVIGKPGHTLEDVRIRSLTVAGFKNNGIWATGVDRLRVYDVTSRNNGEWGIGSDRTTRSTFRFNTIRDNGDAGILVANDVYREGGALDTRGTVVADNRLTGNRVGVTVRRARHLWVDHNFIAGNCGGVFVVGDENNPKAGALTVSRNLVYENNRRCPKKNKHPAVAGAGIVLTAAEGTIVERNRVRGNRGTEPLSGGIVLYVSHSGFHDNRNVVVGNVALNNSPADVANRDKGIGNKFIRNVCQISQPANLCRR